MNAPILFIVFTLLVSLSGACAPSPAVLPSPTPQNAPTEDNFLVLGDISDDPAEVIEGSQPLADYLAAQLADYGITAGKVRVAQSTQEMEELLKRGEVDLYFDSTYPATLLSDATGAQIILRRWRFGVETYHSVIFASKASGITSLEQLAGRRLAMDAPYSTSGYMLPAIHLLEAGLTLAGQKNYTDPLLPDAVNFVFSYDDENTLQWVLNGLTDAGVTDDYHFDVAFPAEAIAQLQELARTEETPRQVVVARPGMSAELRNAITQALTTMHQNEAGLAALEPFQTTRFDSFPEGLEAATARMRAMMELLRQVPTP